MAKKKTYQDKLDVIRKYAESQNVSISSPRVIKYAKAMGINVEDLGVEITDSMIEAGKTEAARKYAERMGLPVDNPTVRRYARSGMEENPLIKQIDIEGSDDEEFKATVLHYAYSQHLELTHPQVQRYARGLLGDAGDFNETKKTQGSSQESTERRINEAIVRYAERMGLPVEHEVVQKYANELKKATPVIFKNQMAVA